MKKTRLIFYSVVTVASVFLFSGWYFLEHGQYVDQTSIFINRISFNENEVVLEGDTSNSALAFAGYNYRFEGENLIIKYRYVPVNPFNRLGHFSVAINQGDKKVQKILIEGIKKGDYKQVWPSEEAIIPEKITKKVEESSVEEKAPEIIKAISPDNKYTAYLVGKLWERSLYIGSGSDLVEAKEINRVDYFTDLSWSSDSQYIIVDRPAIGRASIFNLSDKYPIAQLDYESGPFWSPDGKKLCYTENRSVWTAPNESFPTTDLLVRNLTSGFDSTALARGTKDYYYKVEKWEPGGTIKYKRISSSDDKVLDELSSEYAHFLWALDLSTGERQKLGTIKDREYLYFNPSPDRKWLSLVRLVFSGGEAEGGIPSFYNIKTGELIELNKEFNTWFWKAQWFKDSTRIMLNETTIYNLETGKYSTFQLPQELSFLGGSPAPDGTRLAVFACKRNKTNDTEGQPLILYLLDLEGQIIKTLNTSLLPYYSGNLQSSLPVTFTWLDEERIILESWQQETNMSSVQLLDISNGSIGMNIANGQKPSISPDSQKLAVLELEKVENYSTIRSIKVLTLDGQIAASLHVNDLGVDFLEISKVIWDSESEGISIVAYKTDDQNNRQKHLVKWNLTTGEIIKMEIDNGIIPLYWEKDKVICVEGRVFS